MKTVHRFIALLCCAAMLPCSTAWGQAWPAKPIQMIVPQGAGGSTDSLARLLAQDEGGSGPVIFATNTHARAA